MKKVKSKIPMQYLSKHTQALLVLAIVLASTPILGQTRSGTLDASFGTGGKVTTDFAGAGDAAAAIAIQTDGKLVAATVASSARLCSTPSNRRPRQRSAAVEYVSLAWPSMVTHVPAGSAPRVRVDEEAPGWRWP